MQVIKMLFVLFLCSSFMHAESASDKRKAINTESQETLTMLYKAYPHSKDDIKQAYGYATFSNVGVNVIFFSAEGGSGVTVNNKTNKKTYMKMASGALALDWVSKIFELFLFLIRKKCWNRLLTTDGKPTHKQMLLQSLMRKVAQLRVQ